MTRRKPGDSLATKASLRPDRSCSPLAATASFPTFSPSAPSVPAVWPSRTPPRAGFKSPPKSVVVARSGHRRDPLPFPTTPSPCGTPSCATLRNSSLRSLTSYLALVACGLLVASSGCNSTSGWSRNTVGKRYYGSGDYTAARRSFEQALMNDPWNPNYAFNVAAAMQKQGDQLAAERMYQHALTINPSHQPSYHALAGMLHENGRTDEAQELLTAWTDTQPYVPESHVEMAWMQQELGDYGAAETSLQQALRRNPRHPRAMAQLGQVYERSGRHAEAAALYNRSLAYNRMQPQVASRLNGMQSQMSPGLMLAQQMPQYDPQWNVGNTFSGQSFAQSPAYGPQQPYTTFMTPGVSTTPMMAQTPMTYGTQMPMAQTGYQQMPMQTIATNGPLPTGQWMASPMMAGNMPMNTMQAGDDIHRHAGWVADADDVRCPGDGRSDHQHLRGSVDRGGHDRQRCLHLDPDDDGPGNVDADHDHHRPRRAARRVHTPPRCDRAPDLRSATRAARHSGPDLPAPGRRLPGDQRRRAGGAGVLSVALWTAATCRRSGSTCGLSSQSVATSARA